MYSIENKMKQQAISFLLMSALVCSACSDSQDLSGNIPLSGDRIAFQAELLDGFQSSAAKSRAQSAFTGVAMEQKVLPLGGDLVEPLYLHPLEVDNTAGSMAETANAAIGMSSRGTLVSSSSWTGEFGVSAVYTKSEASRSFFQDQKASKSGNIWYASGDTQAWPTDGALSFYAYAPYQHASLSLQGSDDVTKNKTLRYVASTSLGSQPDLIVAKSENISRTSSSANTAVQLKFSHALTAITFSVSADMIPGTVKSITVKNVSGQGDYNISTGTWGSLGAASASYAISLGTSGAGIAVKAGESKALTDGSSALLMVPQTFAAGSSAQIEMVFHDGNKDRTVTASLAGTSWDAGKHITYVLSASSITTLQLGGIAFPTSWSHSYTSTTNPLKSAYANGDKMGLFVVDDSKKVIASNVQLSYNGSAWSLPSGSKQKFSPKYSYFVYYPYQSSLTGLPAQGASVSDVSSAKAFFSSAISTWSSSKLAPDQSTLDKMNACDLQIGMGSLTSDGTKIQFAANTHAMGLADITLGSKTVPNTYHLSTYSEYTWTHGTTTIHAVASVSGRNLYKVADYHYVTIVKPGQATSFSCGSTSDADAWTEAVLVSPADNAIDKGTATSKRTAISIAHTLAVGDIYYSDGAITKPKDEDISAARANGKTPIGVIGYLGKNKWTESGTGSGYGGHALVLCLRNIGSNGTTDMGSGYRWYSSNEDCHRTKVDTGDKIRGSSDKDYGSGYKETTVLVAKGSAFEAANAAKNYTVLPAPTNRCTGWFLPSAGQYYAVMSQLGGGIRPDDWEINAFFGNMTTVSGKINAALSKVGANQYTEFFQGTNTWAWTSSEFSSTYAVTIDSGVDDSKGSGSVRFYTIGLGKTAQLPVRPFLAF
ncbi:MAG: fimbrillin family protein [Prevotella copri]|nr:fimbrillin family protein [Segatella copri]